jgi:hypothetical protein
VNCRHEVTRSEVLPDVFSYQKYKFCKFLEVLAMEDVGIFYRQFFYFTAIWYTLRTLCIFCGNLVFFPVLVCCTNKIWQLWSAAILSQKTMTCKLPAPRQKHLYDDNKQNLIFLTRRLYAFLSKNHSNNSWQAYIPTLAAL